MGLRVTDKILDWADDPATTFSNESDQKKALYAAITKSGKDWQRPRTCIYRGCTHKSVLRSHTVQRSGVLSRIAENNHLLTPKATPDGLEMKTIGIGDASTFAGFCPKHERLFEPFELSGTIATEHDLVLQIFRSICREIVRKDFDINNLETARTAFLRRLEGLAKQTIETEGAEFKSLEIKGGLMELVDRQIKTAKAVRIDLQEMYDDLFQHLEQKTDVGLSVHAAQINIKIPVALSGLGTLNHKDGPLLCVLGVAPQSNGTLFFMATKPGNNHILENYLKYASLRLVLLDLIEAWMIRGTDHWFLSPSIWASIPGDRRHTVLTALLNTTAGIETMLPFSIFDDLRRSIIVEEEAIGIPPDFHDYFESQKAKLS